MADNGQNPSLEIAGQRKLLLTVQLFGRLRFTPLIHIDTAANKAGERSALIAEGHTAIEDPAIDAVVAAQSILHFERRPAVKVVQVVCQAAIEVVWMDALGPAVAHLLLKGSTGEAQPRFIEVIAAGIQPRAPNHYG